jgi:hypothetical protein
MLGHDKAMMPSNVLKYRKIRNLLISPEQSYEIKLPSQANLGFETL